MFSAPGGGDSTTAQQMRLDMATMLYRIHRTADPGGQPHRQRRLSVHVGVKTTALKGGDGASLSTKVARPARRPISAPHDKSATRLRKSARTRPGRSGPDAAWEASVARFSLGEG